MNVANVVGIHDYNSVVKEVPLFQLLQWKHAIGLEMKGLKMSRGSVTAHVRRFLNCPRQVKREHIFEYLTASLDSIMEQLEKAS